MTTVRRIVSIGNYDLKPKTLGRGTFAKVKLGTHKFVKYDVALKILHKKKINQYALENLGREAKIMKNVDHPNIVKLIEIIHPSSPSIYCLVLEYVAGCSLYDHLLIHGALANSESECQHIGRQLASAIEYLHCNDIIHRDLKLENILLEDDTSRVVLIDFGLSNFWYPGKLMKTHCGSAEYAAPELFDKENNYNSSVDIWSFGVILFTLAFGYLPFSADSVHQDSNRQKGLSLIISKGLVESHMMEMKSLSPNWKRLIVRCLDVNPLTRIKISSIVISPWLHSDEIKINVEDKEEQNLKAATILQQTFEIGQTPEEILSHVKQRRFRSTGGVFNLIKLQLEKKEYAGVQMSTNGEILYK